MRSRIAIFILGLSLRIAAESESLAEENESLISLWLFSENQYHPLIAPRGARTLLTQGAGRAVTGATRLRRVLAVLTSRPTKADTLNALAMILSRRKEAPCALTSDLVGKITDAVSAELVRLAKNLSFQVRFKNALSALAGLFRYREIEPFALLARRDPAAQQLLKSLEAVDALLVRHRRRVSKCDEKRTLVALLQEYLDGAGDPNVLIRIEASDDQQDEAEE